MAFNAQLAIEDGKKRVVYRVRDASSIKDAINKLVKAAEDHDDHPDAHAVDVS